MKAMILAAGLGTRLRPLTQNIPKVLVRVNGRTMLDRVLEKLRQYGFNEVIINLHYLADQVKKYLVENNHFGMEIAYSDETGLLLDTGGGIKKASWFFNDGNPFLVYNADILGDIDLTELYTSHLRNYSLATLAVQKRDTDRLLLFDDQWKLTGWKNNQTGREKKINTKPVEYEMGFCGIHVVSPEIFPWIRQEGVFSIIETYLDLAGNFPVRGYDVKEVYWTDIGNLESLEKAEKYHQQKSL